jgi:hypothetical protein
MFWTKTVVEILSGLSMVIFLFLIFRNRAKQGKGIGERIIQFTCIVFLIQCIIILGLEGVLQGETIATLLGGLGGYVLSSMSQGGGDDGGVKKQNAQP